MNYFANKSSFGARAMSGAYLMLVVRHAEVVFVDVGVSRDKHR